MSDDASCKVIDDMRSSRSKPQELVELPEDGSDEEEFDEGSQSGSGSESGEEEELHDLAKSVDDPYALLGLKKDASGEQIRKAYRKLALKTHPDKRPAGERAEAEHAFKQLALAYAVLSDETRRARYDRTGRLDEAGVEDDDFDWLEYFRQQSESVVDAGAIERARKEYVGTDEERSDVLKAYKQHKGDWHGLFTEVVFSVELNDADERRFRGYIEDAIGDKQVERYPKFDESEEKRKKRLARARREADEAEDLADELGISAKTKGDDALAQLILSRQRERAGKYANMDDDAMAALAKRYDDKYEKKKQRR